MISQDASRHRAEAAHWRAEDAGSVLIPPPAGLEACITVNRCQSARPLEEDIVLKSLRVPEGFEIALAAGPPTIRFPMFACFDEEGGLFVAESSGRDLYAGLRTLSRDCRVSLLRDNDGDGRFEAATVFQDGVTFPMGLAWREGRLYLADPPELVALSDTDGDGRADRREVILSGFGHRDNGSLHGLVFGPDGMLYFTMGEPDGWKLPRGDGSHLEGVAGALFRCRPDGSRPEVISRGFVNLVEVEFMPGGEFVATDNWYQHPAGGYRDALVDCAPGGLYPYAPDRGTPLPRTGTVLPALRLLPAVAHSGLTRLRGPGWPPGWFGSVLTAQHNTRKIVRHELRRDGSTFAAQDEDLVAGDSPDFHPSDVLEDADGSILVVDTGGWYVQHCPTGRIRDSQAPGGIYRVRRSQGRKVTDPWGRSLDWAGATVEQLAGHLRDARAAVADRAARELLRRGEAGPFAAVLNADEWIETRLRALWALAQSTGPAALAGVRRQLKALDPVLVCAAARALALREDRESADALAALLDSTNAPVRRAAAESLAACGSQTHAPRLIDALAGAGDDFERHACAVALWRVADEPLARIMLVHASPRVRQTALHLLDQPPLAALRFTDLAAGLGDEDEGLRAAARSLLERHRDWSSQALPWLREQLESGAEDPANEASWSRLFIAFQRDPALRGFISECLRPEAPAPESTRQFVLRLLPSLTELPPEADWLKAVEPALGNASLRAAALAVATAYPRPEFKPALEGVAEDEHAPIPHRLWAARALAEPVLSEPVLALALGSLRFASPALDRLGAMDLLSGARLTPAQLRRLVEAFEAGGLGRPDALVAAMVRAADAPTRPLLAEFLARQLQSGWLPTRPVLDRVLEALPENEPARGSLLAAWEKNKAGALDRLREFSALLEGGDPARGLRSYQQAACAGCHRIGDTGAQIGPDLTAIGAIRSGLDLLESILYPNSSFAQGYEPYRLTRRDGLEASGILLAQGPEGVQVRDASGLIHRARPDQVASLDRLEISLMPEGWETMLTKEEIRDLLAYLQRLK